jgi:hypothetical protein
MTETDDERLLAALAEVLAEADPPPEWVLFAARAAITTRALDEELAELIGDTELTTVDGSAGLAFEAVRTAAATPEGRMLSFDGGGVQIDLEVDRRGRAATLIGQLTGACPDGCTLEYGDGRSRPVHLDGLGRFLVTVAGRSPVRLRCRSVSGARITSSWISL